MFRKIDKKSSKETTLFEFHRSELKSLPPCDLFFENTININLQETYKASSPISFKETGFLQYRKWHINASCPIFRKQLFLICFQATEEEAKDLLPTGSTEGERDEMTGALARGY